MNQIGEEIKKHHSNTLHIFNSFIKEIREALDVVEKSLHDQMNNLNTKGKLFIDDTFEQCLKSINSEDITVAQFQECLSTLMPLINTSCGNLEVLNDDLKKKMALRVSKSSEIFERETKYWMEKALKQLNTLNNNLNNNKDLDPQIHISTPRFSKVKTNYLAISIEEINGFTYFN